jgi:hypothetical protein
MDLLSLKYIFCRSPAEKDSFFHLLPPEVYLEWNRKILVASKSQIFNCNWTFVETVELSGTRITVNFSPDTFTPGPFNIVISITDIYSGKEYHYQHENFYANGILHISVPYGVGRYNVRLTLDDDLAFTSDFYGDEIPF